MHHARVSDYGNIAALTLYVGNPKGDDVILIRH
ncbi:unnamed protein product, partial [marine sediment metagenome]